ncbi:unnamed protein product [Parascedosporium putredinis]|uniref:Uncharacterized protein n=1 Tax=Parascedosporium putredinis TaxID=1442378 RepID=A0A9P1HAY6_9PEZI|nr:unnamed protein product [Parascedosporium putredinis]CAI8003183.1 unnamed protein product [Parascedosporium putredinis]
MLSYIVAFVARPARTARPQLNESLLALPGPNDSSIACPPDAYAVHIYSRNRCEDLFQPSTITHNGGSAHRDAAVRDSHVAMIPRTDPVRCVERRARAFQGWREELWIERLRTQKYTPGGHYSHHYD